MPSLNQLFLIDTDDRPARSEWNDELAQAWAARCRPGSLAYRWPSPTIDIVEKVTIRSAPQPAAHLGYRFQVLIERLNGHTEEIDCNDVVPCSELEVHSAPPDPLAAEARSIVVAEQHRIAWDLKNMAIEIQARTNGLDSVGQVDACTLEKYADALFHGPDHWEREVEEGKVRGLWVRGSCMILCPTFDDWQRVWRQLLYAGVAQTSRPLKLKPQEIGG